MQLELEWSCGATLGESPLWCERTGSLFFVDIASKRLHCYRPEDHQKSSLELAENTGCIALTREGGLAAAMRSGLFLLDDAGKKLRQLAANPEDQGNSRFNDGKVDPRGRWLIGTLDEVRKTGTAHLYRFDRRGLQPLAQGLITSNGLAFSPDGRHLYHADTPRFVVYRYDYDLQTGAIDNRKIFIRFDQGASDRARPDGAAVDSQGCYWTALYDGARIERYDPEGRLMASHAMPARRPTMPCFGGPQLRTLFVTTASAPGDPHPGGLYAMPVDIEGLPSHRLDLDAQTV